MSTTVQPNSQYTYGPSGGGGDIIHFENAANQVVSWIDNLGTGQGNLASSGGISFVSSLPATCTPGVTQPVQLSVAPFGIYYCNTTNSWTEQGTLTIDAKAYGVKADTIACFSPNVTITNTSKTVSCSTANFTSADIGKIIFAISSSGGQASDVTGTVQLPQGTITSINSSTSVQVSVAATGSTGGVLVWGTDDTSALTATSTALAALPNCGTVSLPQGMMLVQSGQWQTASAGCTTSGQGLSIQAASGNVVKGFGPASSVIVPTPNFNFASAVNAGLFGGVNFMVYDNWSIWGASLGTNGNNSLSIVAMGTESVANNFEVISWLGSDANTTGVTVNGRANVIRVQGAGGTGCSISATAYVINSVCNYSKTTSLNISAGNILYSVNSSFGANNTASGAVAATITGTWYSVNDRIAFGSGATNNIGIEVFTGGIVYLDSAVVGTSAGAGTGIGIYQPGGKVFAKNTSIGGYTSGSSVNLSSSAAFIEQDGGNTYSGATSSLVEVSGSLFNPYRVVNGACTGTANSSSTLGLYGTGPNATVTTCTSATIGSGQAMDHAGTLRFLQANATAGGVGASSGVVTVLKNGSPTSITCTLGTGTFCSDGTHTVSFAIGDLISLQFTTQGTETLAGVAASVSAY